MTIAKPTVPAPAKPIDVKPIDVKPVTAAKPVVAKPMDAKPVVATPIDAKPLTAAKPTLAAEPAAAATMPARANVDRVSPADALVALVEAQEREFLPYLGPDESAGADNAMQEAQRVSAGAAAFADVLSGYGVSDWKVPVLSTGLQSVGAETTEPETIEPKSVQPEFVQPKAAEPGVSDWLAAAWKATTPVGSAPTEITPLDITPLEPAQVESPTVENLTSEILTTGSLTTESLTVGTLAVETVPQYTTDSQLIPRYQPKRLNPNTPLPAALTHLGLPRQLATLITGTDSYREISRVIKLLPTAPELPAGAGELLVIVGERITSMSIASTVAQSLKLPPSRILLAAVNYAGTSVHPARRLTDPAQAATRVAKLRRDSNLPLIVVVDSEADAVGVGDIAAVARPATNGPANGIGRAGGGTRWARSIVESLDPTCVWGVVDVTRKTADSGAWLADIGRVDAIAAHGCAITGDPAAILQLGIPVAMIDGRTATPGIWAELLCHRLEEVRDIDRADA
ncbi:hypothetical protein [Planosporangium thailandense]|nr:hypothetical protein [Planosporangium thailandense]